MLVLSRKVGEEVVIANQVRVRVISIDGQRIRLGIAAPQSIPIHRAEVHQQRLEFQPVPHVTLETLPRSA